MAVSNTRHAYPLALSLPAAPVNDAPVVVGRNYTAREDRNLTITASEGVLKGATDADNDTVTISSSTGCLWGTVTVQSNGSFQYAPPTFLPQTGFDQFNWVASDGKGGSTPGKTYINIGVLGTGAIPGVLDSACGVEQGTPLSMQPLLVCPAWCHTTRPSLFLGADRFKGRPEIPSSMD